MQAHGKHSPAAAAGCTPRASYCKAHTMAADMQPACLPCPASPTSAASAMTPALWHLCSKLAHGVPQLSHPEFLWSACLPYQVLQVRAYCPAIAEVCVPQLNLMDPSTITNQSSQCSPAHCQRSRLNRPVLNQPQRVLAANASTSSPRIGLLGLLCRQGRSACTCKGSICSGGGMCCWMQPRPVQATLRTSAPALQTLW